MSQADFVTEEQIISLWETAREDSVFHVKEIQGVETLEPFQELLMRAVEAHERVAVRSCHDMGKTWTMAKIVLWFLSTHPRAKIVTTAPTARQVKLLLWSEIRAGHANSKYPLGGELGVQEWKVAADWWSIGFTTQKEAEKGQGQANSGFQGIHGEWVLVIFDEATGIVPDIWKQLEGLMTSANVRFVAIGNPTTKASEFYRCFSDSSFKKLHMSCFDSPNLPANGIRNYEDLVEECETLRELPEEKRLARLEGYKIVRPHLVTCKWVMSMALKWGLNHPLFISKALGDFPEEDERVLMPLGMVEAAQFRATKLNKFPKARDGKTLIGVDPARFGGDQTVITRAKGYVVDQVKGVRKRRNTVVAGEVIAMVNTLPASEIEEGVIITVDGTGIGSGVIDCLVEYQTGHPEWRNVEIREVHFGETFKEGRDGSKQVVKEKNEMYANKKAEMFVLLAEDLKDFILPERSDYYSEELPTIIYDFDSKGRWVMEDKKAYKKRTGRSSPDYADSLALTNYGRYHTGGAGTFTEELAKPRSRPLAPSQNSGDLW